MSRCVLWRQNLYKTPINPLQDYFPNKIHNFLSGLLGDVSSVIFDFLLEINFLGGDSMLSRHFSTAMI